MIKIKNIKTPEQISKLKYPILSFDSVFKTIFTENIDTLAKMISDFTGIKLEKLINNIVLIVQELPIDVNHEKVKRCDFIVKFDKNKKINIELNRDFHSGTVARNLSYAFTLFSSNTKEGEKYDVNMQVIQININYKKGQKGDCLTSYYIMNEKTRKKYSNQLEIYSLNIDKCRQLYYNCNGEGIPKYIKWGAFLGSRSIEELKKTAEGILSLEEARKIVDKLEKITTDNQYMSALEAQQWEQWERNTIYSDGIEAGYASGKEEGYSSGVTDTIRSMLENNLDYETISKVTRKVSKVKRIYRVTKRK